MKFYQKLTKISSLVVFGLNETEQSFEKCLSFRKKCKIWAYYDLLIKIFNKRVDLTRIWYLWDLSQLSDTTDVVAMTDLSVVVVREWLQDIMCWGDTCPVLETT